LNTWVQNNVLASTQSLFNINVMQCKNVKYLITHQSKKIKSEVLGSEDVMARQTTLSNKNGHAILYDITLANVDQF